MHSPPRPPDLSPCSMSCHLPIGGAPLLSPAPCSVSYAKASLSGNCRIGIWTLGQGSRDKASLPEYEQEALAVRKSCDWVELAQSWGGFSQASGGKKRAGCLEEKSPGPAPAAPMA